MLFASIDTKVLLKNSFVMSQKDLRHVLVDDKRDTAGRSDPDDVGNYAFVETRGSFVPEETRNRFRTDGSVSSLPLQEVQYCTSTSV